jgi:hypothetical protein
MDDAEGRTNTTKQQKRRKGKERKGKRKRAVSHKTKYICVGASEDKIEERKAHREQNIRKGALIKDLKARREAEQQEKDSYCMESADLVKALEEELQQSADCVKAPEAKEQNSIFANRSLTEPVKELEAEREFHRHERDEACERARRLQAEVNNPMEDISRTGFSLHFGFEDDDAETLDVRKSLLCYLISSLPSAADSLVSQPFFTLFLVVKP